MQRSFELRRLVQLFRLRRGAAMMMIPVVFRWNLVIKFNDVTRPTIISL